MTKRPLIINKQNFSAGTLATNATKIVRSLCYYYNMFLCIRIKGAVACLKASVCFHLVQQFAEVICASRLILGNTLERLA